MSCKIAGLNCTFAKVEGTPCGSFRFDGAELCLFDSIAEEQLQRAGTPIQYWQQDIENSKRDPLYDEPISRSWRGPYNLMAFVEYAAESMEAREEGTRSVWNGVLWIARISLEQAGGKAPEAGDVVRYWADAAFYAKHSVIGANEPGSGYYFDVTNVDTDGHLFDSSKFVGFKLELARRTEFTPERRLRE